MTDPTKPERVATRIVGYRDPHYPREPKSRRAIHEFIDWTPLGYPAAPSTANEGEAVAWMYECGNAGRKYALTDRRLPGGDGLWKETPLYAHPPIGPDVVTALQWYAETVAGCRKLTGEGDSCRAALDADGGKRARAALTKGAEHV